MKYNEAESLLDDALQRFVDFTGTSFEGRIYLLGCSDLKNKRKELFDITGATPEAFGESTMGETISGDKETVIAIYPFNIINKDEFYHVVFHECSHKYFKELNPETTRKQEHRSYGNRQLYGYTLFDEFIAESMANLIKEYRVKDHATKQCELINRLYQALPGINPSRTIDAAQQRLLFEQGFKVLPGALGLYAAMMLTDSTIVDLMQKNSSFDRGLPRNNHELSDTIQDILVWLSEYMQSHENFVVTEEELGELGKLLLKIERIR